MKVFLSSLISGFEPFRAAARAAITTLRHEPLMAEDFGASLNSPQVACLTALREADVVLLVLGDRYGAVQANSGLSATHEEYREARGRKPVIAFVQDGVVPDAEQSDFIAEVQGWSDGLFRGGFKDSGDLQAGVTRALHDYELATAVAPLDPSALVARAMNLLSSDEQRSSRSDAALRLTVVGGPTQRVLRPVQLEALELQETLHREALFGAARIFDGAKGVESEITGAALTMRQERGSSLRLDEEGSVLLQLALDRSERSGAERYGGLSVLVEEEVHARIRSALGFATSVLELIDATQRLTHVAIAAEILGGEHLAWRTRAEHESSPNSVTMGWGYGEERPPVMVSQSRAALRLNTTQIIEDLLVPLRRQWKRR